MRLVLDLESFKSSSTREQLILVVMTSGLTCLLLDYLDRKLHSTGTCERSGIFGGAIYSWGCAAATFLLLIGNDNDRGFSTRHEQGLRFSKTRTPYALTETSFFFGMDSVTGGQSH